MGTAAEAGPVGASSVLRPPTGAATAPPPAPTPSADNDGSTRSGRRINLHADGSGHGGQHYYAAAAAQQQQQQQQHGYPHAQWVVETGAPRSSARPATPATPPGGMPPVDRNNARNDPSVGGGGSGGGKSDTAAGSWGGAVLSIEEPTTAEMFSWGAYWGSLPKKLKGGLDTRLPVPPLFEVFWSWLGAFLGILAVCALNQWASPEIDIAFLVGSFGASAVLVFAVIESKMSQPRNFMGGQILSALVGITTRVIIHQAWIAGPVGMSLALLVMQLTSTTHPPGGATALIAATLPELPKWHGYSYLVTVAVGSLVMQLIALVVNNLNPRRNYPTFWV